VIFRKVALERLSSPEQLDQLVQVTSPRGWLALSALGGLLLLALAWGVFGTIPTEATGEGILLRGVAALVAPGSGPIEEVRVAVGDTIHKGQVVAEIRQEEMHRQLDDARSKVAEAERDLLTLQRSAEDQKRLRDRDLAQKRADLDRTIATLEKDIVLLQERIEAERSLLQDGLVTKQTFLATQQSLNAKADELAKSRLERSGLELQGLAADTVLAQQIEARRSSLHDLELKARETAAKLEENLTVVSLHSGRVLEILVDRGDVVTPGTPILSLDTTSEDLQAVLFVPASTGKKVLKGMQVRVSPSTVKREEFGAILGTVVRVAEFPSTARGMTRQLGNEALVDRLMKEGPPIQVDVALQRDPKTPTGYRWSSSQGPSVEISSGTLASGSVIVREDRPISLVIPTLRQKLGL
jgi:HlyD family secretion protein